MRLVRYSAKIAHNAAGRDCFLNRASASRAVLSCAILLALGLPALAHHSGAAEFDSKQKIDLTGVVTKVEWTNPHAHFYVDVKDSSGNVTNWNLELASPNVLIRNGWHRNSIKAGDMVSVTGIQAKDSSYYGNAS